VAFLELLSGPRSGERIRLSGERVVIGRHPGCDVVIEAPAVSRQHAAVALVGEQAFLEDLQSRNGTRVNGRTLAGRHRLEHGDELQICGQRLVYLSAAPAVTLPGTDDHALVEDLVDDDPPASRIVSSVDLDGPATDQSMSIHAEAKLRAVIGLNRAIGSSLSVAEVLPRLVHGLLDIFPQAQRGFVLLADPQSQRLTLRARHIKGETTTGPVPLSLSLIQQVASSRRAVLSADAASDSRFKAHESVLDCRIRSVMCVPIIRGDGSLLGVLQVDSHDVRDGFGNADLEVLAGVAGQAAQAIEQAVAHDERVQREQLERDLQLARQVQQGLLPSCPPDISGYEVFDFYEAARHVGGDFFGYVPLSDGRLAVVLADVSGKGVSAALLMAALSADIRYCLASERDVAQAVARINESFLRGGWDDRFATLFVAVLDPASHAVTMCNAGHLPAFVREASGRVFQAGVGLGGLPLGMDQDGRYRSCEVDLAPGATLVLFTDGVSEAMNADQQCYGLEQVERVLAATAGGAAAIGRGILADVERHVAGEARSDDVCLVCLSRAPGS
jgi:serine phosphatase RsbU (regulator of sigma subunit)